MNKHLVIAGTGRAGTTFLVQFLGAAGLDVGEFGPDSLHVEADAGLERHMMQADLPYVVKDPWLYTYCHMIDPGRVEALLLPMRRLEDAADSRLRLEWVDVRRAQPNWGADTYGRTPGGAIHSLDRLDQMRVLAVGFYRLIEWVTFHDVEVVLLDFPRIILDADYLCGKLARWLPNTEAAMAAHRATSHVTNG